MYKQQAFIDEYRGEGYDIDKEYYLGPRNKNFLIFKDGDNEIFLNHTRNGEFWFVAMPHYSNFSGFFSTMNSSAAIDIDSCKKRNRSRYYHLSCIVGTSALSHVYAKLTGKENNKTKFDVNLNYQMNKMENLNKNRREYIINLLSKNICLFIGDNVDDLMIGVINGGFTKYGSVSVSGTELWDYKRYFIP